MSERTVDDRCELINIRWSYERPGTIDGGEIWTNPSITSYGEYDMDIETINIGDTCDMVFTDRSPVHGSCVWHPYIYDLHQTWLHNEEALDDASDNVDFESYWAERDSITESLRSVGLRSSEIRPFLDLDHTRYLGPDDDIVPF